MITVEEMNKRFDKGFVSRETFLETLRHDEERIDIVKEVKRSQYGAVEYETLNVPAAFDIETTQVKETEAAFMYIWMLSINGVCTYGRTWEEFQETLREIRKIFKLNDRRSLIIYIHHEGFEMSFMMPRFYTGIKDYFAIAPHEPVKVEMHGFTFKDSLVLSAKSLDATGKDLTIFKVRKRVGDLDYSKMRNSKTPMTEEELGYCLDDVRVLSAYIWEQMHTYGDNITKIPMTNTGRVREYYRENCLYKTTSKGKRIRNNGFCKYIKDKVLTPETYAFARECFMGGFTHAGHLNSGKVKEHVHSMDFTSSYPAVMVSEKFPCETMQEVCYKSWDEYDADVKAGYCVMMSVELKDINDGKFPYEHYISKSSAVELGYPKTHKDGTVEVINDDNTYADNGRILKTDRIVIYITNPDWDIIKKTYSIGSAKILKAYRAKSDYFRSEEINCLLTLYEGKTTLKDVEGMESEYQLKKGMTNSSYGMKVQDVVNAEQIWNKKEDWETVAPSEDDVEKIIEKYNKSNKRFTSYIDGIYITAYARHNLFEGIMELKEDYCYSDTDSVKFTNLEKHKDFFDEYNKRIVSKIDACLTARKIDPNRSRPKTVKGEEKQLGVWDYEGYYDKFKTMGAKRYIIQGFHRPDGSLKAENMITIAGVNKKNGCKYIFEQEDPFGFFNEGMIIPAEFTEKDGTTWSPSGKLACVYRNKGYGGIIIDDYGNAECMWEDGGCYLKPVAYNMSIDGEYADYLDDSADIGTIIGKLGALEALLRAC